MNILVTGGAGYIGSVLTTELISKGHKVIVLDHFRSGHEESIAPEAEIYKGDYGYMPTLKAIFSTHHVDTVVHLAASMSPTDSIIHPSEYLQNNVAGSLNLVDAMLNKGVKKLIFSSSACIYGDPRSNPVREDSPRNIITPYGESKLMFETILKWYNQAYGLDYTIFRFFNVSGASSTLGPMKAQNNGLIPNALNAALGKLKHLPIYGDDYPTPDGTCIRDYIHVKDIVQAHILALGIVNNSGVYNLGTETGYSVFEVVERATKVIQKFIPTKIVPRRPGEPAVLISSATKAKRELGWVPEYSELDTIIKDTWEWLLR